MIVGALIVLLILDVVWIAHAILNAPAIEEDDLSLAPENISN